MPSEIQLFQGKSIEVEITPSGTRIHGRLAYPGISKNGKLYTIGELLHADGITLPIWLNHATTIGIDKVGDDLLPPSYRSRLMNGETIILGACRTWFDPEELMLMYEGFVTDEFYKNPEILKRLSVSQGVLHPQDLPEHCDGVLCYKIMKNSVYEEMSLVFSPGFSVADLSIECVDCTSNFKCSECASRNVYKHAIEAIKIMAGNNNTKSAESGSSKEQEGQASGTMPNANNPSTEDAMVDARDGTQKKVATEPLPESVSTQVSGEANDDEDKDKDKSDEQNDADDKKEKDEMKKSEEAIKAAEAAAAELKKAKENFVKATAKVANSVEAADDSKKTDDDEDKGKSSEGNSNWFPNADVKDRQKAQAEYVKSLEAQAAKSESLLSVAKKAMEVQKQNVASKARIGTANNNTLTKSIEGAEQSPKQWIDGLIKGSEQRWNKTWIMDRQYLMNHITPKFKVAEGYDTKMVSYKSVMDQDAKSVEAENVAMAGGVDPNNFQRTQSELVLVFPDGMIVTPIQQFCETAILSPGKKEHLFYDVNVPTFAATDEENLDAGGGGYALAASDVTINASGGKTLPQGGLVRIGFTNLEEIPIDVIQKVNIGFAMRSEERKNFEALNTAYNTDTAYAPATDAVRPKGGGAKHVVDSIGNRHWINGNTGAEITAADGDSGATGALTFAALLAGKKKIEDTGLSVENLMMYTTTQAVNDVIQDSNISSYVQRSVPEVITEGVIEKLSGVQLIKTNSLATHPTTTNVSRSVMFIPTVSFGFVTGRELQVDAERVARQQSVFASASIKIGAFVKRVESTCRLSSRNTV